MRVFPRQDSKHPAIAFIWTDEGSTAVASTRVQSWGDEPPNGVGCGKGTPLPTLHILRWFGGKGLGNQYWSAISEST